MTTQEIFPALLAFILGLLAKFLYDLWAESRQKKSIVFTKKVINSFSVSMLGEKLRDRAEVLFDKKEIKSVHIVSVEIENVGLRAIKNQAFTVRFGDKAQILGVPTSKSSSEDLRYVKDEQSAPNSHRFTVSLLLKKRKLAWEFIVLNTDTKDFVVEHGISSQNNDFTDTDLDVDSTIVTSKIQLDLISQIKQTLLLAFSIVAMGILIDPISNLWGSAASFIMRAIAILLSYLLFNAISKVIRLYLENKSLNEMMKAQGNNVEVDIRESSGATITIAGRDIYNPASSMASDSVTNESDE